jgi:hypothetical protein
MTREVQVDAALACVAETVRQFRNILAHPRLEGACPALDRDVEAHRHSIRVLEAVEGTDPEVRQLMIQFRRVGERVWKERRWLGDRERVQQRADRHPEGLTTAATAGNASPDGVNKNEPSTGKSRRGAEPPRVAHYALYLFVPRKTRDNLIGDLVEKYREVMLPVFGRRRADFWFWWQAVRSMFAMLPGRVAAFFTLRWLVDWVRHALTGS